MDLDYYKVKVDRDKATLDYIIKLQSEMGWIARIFQGQMMKGAIERAEYSLSQSERTLEIQIRYPDNQEGNLRKDIDAALESIVQIKENIENYSDVLEPNFITSYYEMIKSHQGRVDKWRKRLESIEQK